MLITQHRVIDRLIVARDEWKSTTIDMLYLIARDNGKPKRIDMLYLDNINGNKCI